MTEEQLAIIHEGAGIGPYLHTTYVRHAFFSNDNYWLHSWYPEEDYSSDVDQQEFRTIEELEQAMVASAALEKWDWN